MTKCSVFGYTLRVLESAWDFALSLLNFMPKIKIDREMEGITLKILNRQYDKEIIAHLKSPWIGKPCKFPIKFRISPTDKPFG